MRELSPEGKAILEKLDADFAKVLSDFESEGRAFLERLIAEERARLFPDSEEDA